MSETPDIIGVYRVKNEEKFIEKSLRSVEDICSKIVVLDDGSTDDTVEICKSFDKVIDVQQQFGKTFDEARDRNRLLKMTLKQNCDYLLFIDGDEIFMPNSKDLLFEELTVIYPHIDVFAFQFLLMWDKPNQYRYDGARQNIWHKRLIRMKSQPINLQYNDTDYPGNLHCRSIPHNTIGAENYVRSNVKILHYGCYSEKDRQAKFEWYNKMDPNSQEQDNYVHVISDKGRFSGPHGFEFKTLPDGLFIKDV